MTTTTTTSLRSLSAPAQALLGSDAVAHAWTQNPDGTAQVSVVWVLVHGDEVLFGCHARSRKAQNLQRNPAIVLSVEDDVRNASGYQRHLVIRGRAALERGPHPALMDRLAAKYTGLGRHPLALRDDPASLMVRVQVERISGVGPWLDALGDAT